MKDIEAGDTLICVKIRTSLDFKKIFGQGRFEVPAREGITLREFLDQLIRTWGEDLGSRLFHPDDRTVLPHIMLMVNGQNINFLNRLDTVLHDDDEVLILPPVAGG
jgi:molybdopterin converting factor small subunit